MQQVTMSSLVGQKLFQAKPKHTEEKPALKRIGKVHQLVFSPDGCTVVGVLIKRRDIAGMVKRDDLFVALDALQQTKSGLLLQDIEGATEDGARQRLKLDWNACIIWAGMDVKTEEGQELGYVTDVRFDFESGAVAFIGVSDGSAAQSVVGQLEVPSGLLKGYQSGWMIVDSRAANLDLSGGLAGQAGIAAAKIKDGGRKVAEKAKEKGAVASEKASVAAEKGAFALGKQLGRTKGMFADFKREFDKNSK